MSLRGKVAVVTGASRGIGRGIALQLGEAGAKVYITGRDPKNKKVDPSLPTLEKTAQGITCLGSLLSFFRDNSSWW
jgi:NAD(P)-dependent dehydrogenase (short-subunit alcohol dehydrogenase family)